MEVLPFDVSPSLGRAYNNHTCGSAGTRSLFEGPVRTSANKYNGNVICMNSFYSRTEKEDAAIRIIDTLWADENVIRVSGLLINGRIDFLAQLRDYTSEPRLRLRRLFLAQKENSLLDNSLLYCFSESDEYPLEPYFAERSRN